jgi:hypothetical protein
MFSSIHRITQWWHARRGLTRTARTGRVVGVIDADGTLTPVPEVARHQTEFPTAEEAQAACAARAFETGRIHTANLDERRGVWVLREH